MSWIAPLLLIAAQAAAPAAAAAAEGAKPVDPEVAAQVPLIAGKLQGWQGAWGAVDGKLACRTMKSTGDSEIDMIGCGAMMACVKPVFPKLKALADGPGSEADKKAKMGTILAGQSTCLKERRGQGIAALALKRGAS
ncbi:hypothetical protein GRI40_09170 [Altererythrobacter aerius]|uniref:Uncharacterized protein n=1 Tax=Tsuneonella aeria TaxID=1837929 RepID=A0A6I4TDS7_9SPHN|nr:hypothetical protein [Tsuneonella aeria]MXO75382.1 hypothetical protein [Tsuneonella aeria]